ncbi:segregation/condensation protein A [Salinigranum rubrum]|uniref:Segregation/condensation protein A n=1 Tax=Salinigranum rubrum TaxID=755307 RepID=A0A2I8VGA2_9EURY|nr:ScpA family protein [Salinigranum rubrum]AUV80946.1 segregation/condensation protein A [Salinigranum rubrum]
MTDESAEPESESGSGADRREEEAAEATDADVPAGGGAGGDSRNGNGNGNGFYRDGTPDDVADFSLDLTTPREGSNGESEPAPAPFGNGSESTNGESAPTDSTESTNGEPDSTDGASKLLTDATDVSDSDDDGEVEPVELLVQLAEEGEIDPWDIDIVAVTDAFLERLDESDLRTSGRALFYASVLLRMKSDEILAPDDPEPEESWAAEMSGGEFDYDPIDALESEIDRRLDRKHARGSPETLDELVRDLREAEHGSWWKEGRTYDTSGSPQGYNRGTQTLDYHAADDFRDEGEPGEADVTGTTHMEDIESTIADVERALRTHYDKGRDEVLFAEIRDVGGRRVQTFLALLFLAHRGVVHLQQDELFGDLWVQNPAVVAVGDEAVAD